MDVCFGCLWGWLIKRSCYLFTWLVNKDLLSARSRDCHCYSYKRRKKKKKNQEINLAQMQTSVCFFSASPHQGAFDLLGIKSEAVDGNPGWVTVRDPHSMNADAEEIERGGGGGWGHSFHYLTKCGQGLPRRVCSQTWSCLGLMTWIIELWPAPHTDY